MDGADYRASRLCAPQSASSRANVAEMSARINLESLISVILFPSNRDPIYHAGSARAPPQTVN